MVTSTQAKYPFLPDFEIAVLRSLLSEPPLVARLAPHLTPEGFNREEIILLSDGILEHFKLHGSAPTPVAALQIIKARVESGQVKHEALQRCALAVEEAEEGQGADVEFVAATILGEARKRAVWTALDGGLRDFRQGDYDLIADRMVRAASIGQGESSPGTDHASSLAKRTDQRRTGVRPRRWNTGIVGVDSVIRGGLAAGELGVIIGAPKQGKSMYLTQIVWAVMALGGQVFYYTLEMNETEVIDRIDSAISRIPLHLLEERADYVQTVIDDWHCQRGGGVLVKQLPGYETTVREIDAHIRQQRLEASRIPSVVIVDSADFMTSMKGGGESKYEEQGSVYVQLKGLARKWEVPTWTASWANRDSLEKEIVTMGDIADSFKKCGVADLGLAICASEEMKQQQMANIYVAFCRFAPMGVKVGPLKTAFAEGRFASEIEVMADE